MTDDESGEYVVHPEGELDLAIVAPLRDEWTRIIREQRPSRFVIDLDRVTFLDSSALSVMVQIHRRQLEHQGHVAVVNAAPASMKLLRITGLDRVFEVNERRPTST